MLELLKSHRLGSFEYVICWGLYCGLELATSSAEMCTRYKVENWFVLSRFRRLEALSWWRSSTHIRKTLRVTEAIGTCILLAFPVPESCVPKDVCSTCRTGTDMASRGLESEAKGMTTDKVWNKYITRPTQMLSIYNSNTLTFTFSESLAVSLTSSSRS